MYSSGAVRVRPDLRPTWSSSNTGAPFTVLPSRPPERRYSITFAFVNAFTTLARNVPGGGIGGDAGIVVSQAIQSTTWLQLAVGGR